MKRTLHISVSRLMAVITVFCILFSLPALSQVPLNGYFKVRDNAMFISFNKKAKVESLDTFARKFNLLDIGLYELLLYNRGDSLRKNGWDIDYTNPTAFYISKPLDTAAYDRNPEGKIVFSAVPTPENWRVIGGNKVIYGINKFRKEPFRYKDGIVYFVLRGYTDARKVKLAGNFTNWQFNAFPMEKTADGWMVAVKLKPGQYYYKFIINEGRWITDPDNELKENDGRGNINSYFFIPNKTFLLEGYESAREVNLAGNFNNWDRNNIPLRKEKVGWVVDLYLDEGTYEYQFIADGKIVDPDKGNKDVAISNDGAYVFKLSGYNNARKVFVAGDFNDWKPSQLPMKRTAAGWELSYVLGPGNYQYKFIVDGQWITDPANPSTVETKDRKTNSFMVVGANYTFALPGYSNAKTVYLTGDFCEWAPRAIPMRRGPKGWEASVFLGRGKHTYKFVVDGKWILDPNNKLWEDNEFGTGNSVIWLE